MWLGKCQSDAKNWPLTLKHWVKKIERYTIYITVVIGFDRPATLVVRTNRLSLSKCLDLLRPVEGLPFVVDEVGAVVLEVT